MNKFETKQIIADKIKRHLEQLNLLIEEGKSLNLVISIDVLPHEFLRARITENVNY